MTTDEIKAMLGQKVTARHWTGMQFDGTLIGYVDRPSVIIVTDDGEKLTYAVEMFDAIEARDV